MYFGLRLGSLHWEWHCLLLHFPTLHSTPSPHFSYFSRAESRWLEVEREEQSEALVLCRPWVHLAIGYSGDICLSSLSSSPALPQRAPLVLSPPPPPTLPSNGSFRMGYFINGEVQLLSAGPTYNSVTPVILLIPHLQKAPSLPVNHHLPALWQQDASLCWCE